MALIEVHGHIKRYGDHTAVDGAGFAVDQGEIFGCDTGAAPAIPGCPARLRFSPVELTGCPAL